MIRKFGTPVTAPLNMSEPVTRMNKTVVPGNLYFDKTKAAIEAKMICPKVPTDVINTELNIYRLMGTHESVIKINRLRKLRSVGSLAIKVGGKIQNSWGDFKENDSAKIIGNAIMAAITRRKMVRATSPLTDLEILALTTGFLIMSPPYLIVF